jgi:hypothetical protein
METFYPLQRYPQLSTEGKPMRKGTQVEWKWGNGTAEGKIEKKYEEKVTRTIKGKKVTRNADSDNPAYLVRQEKGAKALKSDSELKKAN